MSNVISFDVYKNTMRRTAGLAPVSSESGYSAIECNFKDGDDWLTQNIETVTAGFFVSEDEVFPTVADIANNKAVFKIPGALVNNTNPIYFGIAGSYGSDPVVTIATNVVKLDVVRGVVITAGDPSSDPYVDLYQQLLASMNNKVDWEDSRMLYYTPEMYGAKGDGVTDDAEAIQEMFDSVPLNALCVFYKNYKINSGIVIDRAVNVLMYGKIIVSNALDFGIRISGHNVRRNKFRFNLEAESYWLQWGTVKYTVKESVSNGNVIYVNQKIENNSYHIGRFLNVGGTSVEILDCGYDEADGVKVYKFQVADGVTCQAGDVIVVEDSTSYNTIGLDLYETWENEFDISLTNFNTGIRLISGSSDCTYNKIFIRNIFDCKKAILLTGDPNHSGGTTAQNTFIGGRIGASGLSYLHLDYNDITDCYFPMKSECIGSRTNNNNNFFGVSFESGFGVQALPYANRAKVKADFIYGSFVGCRFEGITGFEAQDFCTVIAGYAFDYIPKKSGNYNSYGNNDCYIETNSQPIKLKRFGNFNTSTSIVELLNNGNHRLGSFKNTGVWQMSGVSLMPNKRILANFRSGEDILLSLYGVEQDSLSGAKDLISGNGEWGFSINQGYIVSRSRNGTPYVIQPIYTSLPTSPTTDMVMFCNGKPMWYNGTNWVYANGDTTFDLTDYQTLIDTSHKLSADLVDDTNKRNKFVTAEEKTGWSGKYEKPSGGIPKTDLANDVQTSLGKADSALQAHQDITGKEDKSNKVTSMTAQSTDAQYPSAKAVYDALGGKADTSDIPTKTSDLNNDSGFLTSHQSLANYYTKSEVDNAIPTVPTNVSAFTNDAGYLTSHQSLSNYYSKSDVNNLLSGKANASSVPTKTSDLTNDSGFLTSHQSLANYYNKTEVNNMLDGKANASHSHTGMENTSNKVTSISSSSTDNQYPTAKCVYDLIGDIETLLSQV